MDFTIHSLTQRIPAEAIVACYVAHGDSFHIVYHPPDVEIITDQRHGVDVPL